MNNLTFAVKEINEWVTNLLSHAGLSTADATIVSGNIVQAEIRGVKSHGLILLPIYIRRILRGGIKTKYSIKIIKDKGSLLLLDGGGGPGQIVATEATSLAINRAVQYGISNILVRNSNHVGMLATYGLQAVGSRLIAIIMSNTSPSVSTFGSVVKRMGNNAICFAIPCKPDPLVFDMASGTVASGKIKFAAMHNCSIPKHWLYDKNGMLSKNPKDLDDGGSVTPVGGYKGYGLSVVIDILTSLVAGGTPSLRVLNQEKIESQSTAASQSFMMIDPDMFTGYDYFVNAVTEYVEELRKTIPADKNIPVMAPGDPELLSSVKSLEYGITITEQILYRINKTAQSVGMDPLR